MGENLSWLNLLELGITTLFQVLAKLKPQTSATDAKLAAEITAAIDKLKAARDQVVTQPELESLRTTPAW